MPRYKYYCEKCEYVTTVFHGMNEEHEQVCTNQDCLSVMTKAISNNFITKNTKNKQNKIGQITKEYIEKNKQILETQKQEAIEQTYE